jgi:hypothetical protein
LFAPPQQGWSTAPRLGIIKCNKGGNTAGLRGPWAGGFLGGGRPFARIAERLILEMNICDASAAAQRTQFQELGCTISPQIQMPQMAGR